MHHRDLKARSAENADSCIVRSSQHSDNSIAISGNVSGLRTGLMLQSGFVKCVYNVILMRHNHMSMLQPFSTNSISCRSKGVSISIKP